MPKTVTIEARTSKREGAVASCEYKLPESLDEAKEMWGEEVSLSRLNANVVIYVQGVGRSGLEKEGVSVEQASQAMAAAVPGVQAQRYGADPEAAFLAKFRAADKKEQDRMLALLKGGK
jgi:hypothetical protein